MYLDRFKSNHDTVSLAMSLECDDENWVDDLVDNPIVTYVDMFFEDGTSEEKIERHKGIAEKNGLKILGCFPNVTKEEIKEMIEYVKSIGGIVLETREEITLTS